MTNPLSKPEPAPVRAELSDEEIVALIHKHFPWQQYPRAAEALTYEKSPPMFPQATYDVPRSATTAFVRDIERHALAASDEKDKRIAALEANLAVTRRERDDAIAAAEPWQKAYETARAELDAIEGARIMAETEDGGVRPPCEKFIADPCGSPCCAGCGKRRRDHLTRST